MAINFTPDDVASGFNLTKLNGNFAKVDTALQDALSRSGTGPNQMNADIDLNSNDLLNVSVANVDRMILNGDEVTPINLASNSNVANIAIDGLVESEFTDTGEYTFRDILEKEVNLLMFSPSLDAGVDVSLAMQRMMNAAAATGKPARIPVHPFHSLGRKWRIASGVTVAGCEVLCDKNAIIETIVNINMFTFTAHSVIWEGGELEHHGDGVSFDTGLFDDHVIRKVKFEATSVTATQPLIFVRGSNIYIEQPDVTTSRTNAYTIIVRKVAGTLNINNRIDEPYMGGTGLGILVDSEEAVNRVEGLSIIGAKCVLTGSEQLTVRAVLELIVSDGLWDLGSGTCILFNPQGSGVDGVSIDNNWISTGSSQTGVSGGVAIRSLTGTAAVDRIQIINNRIRFSAFGIALTDNVTRATISKNIFTDIDQTDIGGPADDWDIEGNIHSDSADFALSITEGAGGGTIQIRNERFAPSPAVSVTIVTRSRWVFGDTVGKRFRNKTGITAVAPSTGSFHLVPHGLIAAPRVDKIFLSGNPVTGSYTEILVNVAAIDATNVTVVVTHNQVTAGSIALIIDCEI